ncbi:MAG: DUF541 domain-containing protein [Anaerolineales bacterium]|nr:DUF541 domain-containing protein [Anaerolineales bacterium]
MKALPIALAGILTLSAFIPSIKPATSESNGTISVSGDAMVKVVPDEVILTLGVETMHERLSTAKQQNDQKVHSVIDRAKRHGVQEKYIQTDFINITPVYEDHYDRLDELIGYRVGRTIVITSREIDAFDDLLSDVLEGGANYVHGIEFRTTELRKYRDQARALAIQAAKEKAVALAQELEQQVGEPLSIAENASGWWSSYGGWWGSRWSSYVPQNVIQNAGGDAFVTEGGVAPGQIGVSASVSVTFALK